MEQILTDIASKVINIEELSIEVYLVRHVNQAEKYKSWQISLGNLNSNNNLNDLNSWLRNNIQDFLEKLLIGEELNIVEYNSELQLNDTIAHIDFSDNNYSSIESQVHNLV